MGGIDSGTRVLEGAGTSVHGAVGLGTSLHGVCILSGRSYEPLGLGGGGMCWGAELVGGGEQGWRQVTLKQKHWSTREQQQHKGKSNGKSRGCDSGCRKEERKRDVAQGSK